MIREGIEDFEMLKLDEKLIGADWVLERVHIITNDLTTHTSYSELFDTVRSEIGQTISDINSVSD